VSARPVTVAIPVLNGGELLREVLDAVARQRLQRPVELLVADSGSTDGSRELAERYGARLIDVAPGEFSHGGTRNVLMERAAGAHVAFLTQDSVPADERWLERLLAGFELGERVGLAFGPYLPRPGASPMLRRELRDFFRSLAPDGEPRLDPSPFFSDANGCVARHAWEDVPFREVSYAEDQMLAADMQDARFAKTYHPGAAVVHSHDYPPVRLFRRSFDEWRGLREVRGVVESGNPWRIALAVQREVRDDLNFVRAEGGRPLRALPASLAHHCARRTGAATGSRAERMPPRVRKALSLEGRP
jgi:glycosyltransferase involved in cell wall biosynthesis